jgi:hypothetical protein
MGDEGMAKIQHYLAHDNLNVTGLLIINTQFCAPPHAGHYSV